jgi:rhamnosyltransferase
MKSICLFSSYFTQNKIPFYVKFYLEELKHHFDELVFITNEKDLDTSEIDYLRSQEIHIEMVVNEGYDFGMWYKIISKLKIEKYSRIGLVNDSCVLFRKLDRFIQWFNENDLDYCGLIDSNEISYHIQSYFIVINSPALTSLRDYFLNNGIINNKDQVIRVYEVGLSGYMIQKGFKLGAFYSFVNYSKDKTLNILNYKLVELLRDGLPVIKRQTALNYLTLTKKFKFIKWLPKIRRVNRILSDCKECINLDILLQDYFHQNNYS